MPMLDMINHIVHVLRVKLYVWINSEVISRLHADDETKDSDCVQ